MAKFGEGDKRWIVTDRPDGTNVHNWHWVERDCLEWSRSLLSSLLSNLTIQNEKAGIFIRTKTLEKLEGEAYINVRKGKIIPGYELSFSLSFDAEARIDSGDDATPPIHLTGSFEVPYLADENAGEDPEIRITIRDEDGPVGQRVKDCFFTKGKFVIFEKIQSFVQAMEKGGPAKEEIEEKKASSFSANLQEKKTDGITAGKLVEDGIEKIKKEKKEKKEKKVKEGFKTIEMRERFSCRARDIYEILMDENRWKGFTQSNARICNEVGGNFSLFDGSIVGVNEVLEEGKLIVQKWRFSSWVDGVYSLVRLDFDEPEPGVVIVKLTQTGVPEDDRFGNSTVVENTEKGWRELIFHKIRALFGFGI